MFDLQVYRAAKNPFTVDPQLIRFVTFKNGETIYQFEGQLVWRKVSTNEIAALTDEEIKELEENIKYYIAKLCFRSL